MEVDGTVHTLTILSPQVSAQVQKETEIVMAPSCMR